MTVMLDRPAREPAPAAPPGRLAVDELLTPPTISAPETPAREIPAVEVRAVELPAAGIAPAPAGRPARTRRLRWQRTTLSAYGARMAALLMVIGFVAGAAVEPAPTGPQPVLPFWADALGNVTLVVLLASWGMLATGRRSGLWLGSIASAGLVTETALCPALDHHVIAGWWWANLAIGVALLALNVGLLARTRPDRSRPTAF